MSSLGAKYTLPVVIPASLAWIWLRWVNKTVPKPYLDEFFHIPQAQVYCEGRYSDWDDKITTPPGLYVLSIIWARLLGYKDCSADTLRTFNVFVIATTAVVAGACRATLEQGTRSEEKSSSFYSIHTAVNVALFPVLFFFSGLYYTDVLSTCMVLLAYRNHLGRVTHSGIRSSFLNDMYTVLLGVLALLMRQTNVFWVVVHMGALEAVQAIKDIRVTHTNNADFSNLADQLKFYMQRCSTGYIHDPVLSNAWPQDLALCVISIGVAAFCNPGIVLRRVYPYVIVMGLFAGFVIWNGGVVLGDKSNHVATLHLPQMLYIWPLFAFFSAPLFIPQGLRFVQSLYRLSPSKSASNATSETKEPGPSGPPRRPDLYPQNAPQQSQPLKLFVVIFSNGPLHSCLLMLIGLAAALLIVHFNTIIHPFTLADNRHYMFYIFRYSILRGSLVRHALAPVYVLCGYLSWTTLCGPPSQEKKDEDARTAPTTSTVLFLLLATTLSLITAPLVEPRYFILPWVFWRLLVPAQERKGLDYRLALETLWFLLVNAVTMYIFITRPFYWKAQDGTLLDDGNVQRFMW